MDWRTILPILAEYEPNLPLSIEDHKWLFDFHVFDDQWSRLHPDLTREEYGRVMQWAWRCQQRVWAGELASLDEYEKIPHAREMEERLSFGRDYLRGMIRELGLADRPGFTRPSRSLSMTPRG